MIFKYYNYCASRWQRHNNNSGRETDEDKQREDTNIVFQSETPNVTTMLPDNVGIKTGKDKYMFLYIGCSWL